MSRHLMELQWDSREQVEGFILLIRSLVYLLVFIYLDPGGLIKRDAQGTDIVVVDVDVDKEVDVDLDEL